LNHIDQIQHDLPTCYLLLFSNITREDYQALESSIQRAEAEIRKHIKIEQQLKIYMDNLEEKISEQQHKLAVEG
jgi:CHASE3 domain sensor protein